MVIASLAAALACGAAIAWALYSQRYESTDDAQVDGHLNVVSSRISGTTAAVYVTDNQTVEAGQPLVDLDPSEQKVAYAQAKAQYDQAVAQLNAQRPSVGITEAENEGAALTGDAQVAQARAAAAAATQDLASTSAKLAQAEALRERDDAELRRYEQLFQAGTLSRQDYERSVAAARTSEADATAAKANVASAEKVLEQRKADIDAQAARREQTARTSPRQLSIRQADLATAEANVESGGSTTPACCSQSELLPHRFAGARNRDPAQRGNRQSRKRGAASDDDRRHRRHMGDGELQRNATGQNARGPARSRIHVDALKKDFAGTVEGIPAITGARSSVLPPENATGNYIKVVQRMPVRIRLKANQAEPERLRPGMSVEATVWLR